MFKGIIICSIEKLLLTKIYVFLALLTSLWTLLTSTDLWGWSHIKYDAWGYNPIMQNINCGHECNMWYMICMTPFKLYWPSVSSNNLKVSDCYYILHLLWYRYMKKLKIKEKKQIKMSFLDLFSRAILLQITHIYIHLYIYIYIYIYIYRYI